MQKSRVDSAIAQTAWLLRDAQCGGSKEVGEAIECVLANQRLSVVQGTLLFEEASLPVLSLLATLVRLRLNGLKAYYNRNAHIEPTNGCLYHCTFCSFRRDPDQSGCWHLSKQQIYQRAKACALAGNTELHITGGVAPDWHLSDYLEVVAHIHQAYPQLHIKAYSAVELCSVFDREDICYEDGLRQLQAVGLGSLPGGGAEILDDTLRARICPDKCDSKSWLRLHATWHRLGGVSNATMLFGHLESYRQRVEHLDTLRALQDTTHGFNSFIPLKYRSVGNSLSAIGEVALPEVMRTYAVSRIYLDNFPHLKGYWPMLGKENLGLVLDYGVDDLDGTICRSTKIYSMAGATDQAPEASVDELELLVREAGYIPVERDSYYRACARSMEEER